MLLEVEGRRGRVLLRLTRDYPWRATRIGKVPLVARVSGVVVRVLRAALHVQRILPDELHITGCVRSVMLGLVPGGHDAADVVLVVLGSRVAGSLLISGDAAADAQIPLHADLRSAAGGVLARGCGLVAAQLAAAIQTRRVLHDACGIPARVPGRRVA